MTRVTQGGAPAPFHFMVGVRIYVVNLKYSVPYESLMVLLFEKPDFTQANYMLISGFIFMIVGQP